MCKQSPMFRLAAWLMAVIFLCMVYMEDEANQLVCIIAASVVGCVFMFCESRVQRAKAPLVIRKEPSEAKEKPPDRTA